MTVHRSDELLENQVIGPYTMIYLEPPNWLVQCKCGKSRWVSKYQLVHNPPKDCTCRRATAPRPPKHAVGELRSPEYATWTAMKQRCNNPNNPSWKGCAARGVTVCTRWTESYNAFLADMGRRPGPRYVLQLLHRSASYEPGNCKWALRGQVTAVRVITIDGVTKTMADWCRATGVPYKTAERRIQVLGWTPQEAVQTPVDIRFRGARRTR